MMNIITTMTIGAAGLLTLVFLAYLIGTLIDKATDPTDVKSVPFRIIIGVLILAVFLGVPFMLYMCGTVFEHLLTPWTK